MRRGVFLLFLLGLVWSVTGQTNAVTGILDEGDAESYVVLEPSTMRQVAVLQPGRLRTENFAKFLGDYVRVRGRTAGAGLRVDSIERIAQAPATGDADRAADRHVSDRQTHSLTGFVHREGSGRWVLRADGNQRVLAVLAGATGLSRFRGRKVLVEGDLRAGERDGAILDVESIELFQPGR